jgi:hypothetical protein
MSRESFVLGSPSHRQQTQAAGSTKTKELRRSLEMLELVAGELTQDTVPTLQAQTLGDKAT